MFRSKTVFIIGAGASKEVGLPIGNELKKIIARKLDLRFEGFNTPIGKGDMAIYHFLSQAYGDQINAFLEAGWQIRDGIILSNSIDDFIDVHQHDARIAVCAKMAIASSILEAERASKLYFERKNVKDTINFAAIADTWYMYFYQLLAKQVPKSRIQNIFDNITVVNFNYDRCVEHFLVHALMANYQVSIETAQELVQQLTMFHPYGTVGPYLGRPGTLEFGFRGLRPVSEIIPNIKTYTEQIEEGIELRKIRKAIDDAEVIVFLGTAFHPNNISMLREEQNKQKQKRFYATRKGISDSDLLVVCGEIGTLAGSGFDYVRLPENMFFAQECHDLFEQYQRGLAR
jgi:hypothetical protein